MKSWIDKWPIEVYQSNKQYETFIHGGDEYIVTHVTLAFMLKIDSLKGMKEHLNQIEKRLFISVLSSFKFTETELPIKKEGDIWLRLFPIYDQNSKLDFGSNSDNTVKDVDIKMTFENLAKTKKIIMTDRRPWKHSRMDKNRMYYRRMAFAKIPKEAKLQDEELKTLQEEGDSLILQNPFVNKSTEAV